MEEVPIDSQREKRIVYQIVKLIDPAGQREIDV